MFERFGKDSDIPEPPECPECVEHVAQWFYELSRRRAPAMSGVAPIQYRDIQAWIELTGTLVIPEEVEMILAMDDAYREAIAEIQNEQSKKNDKARNGLDAL